MTLKQKSDIQRLLGNIEGIAFACEENVKGVILDSVQAIDEILKKDGAESDRKDQ
ncbi:MAG: hypothetical protein IKL46_02050 [Clostridia bacterium]|nr:hypothetical protein [Clostridia bacterium]